MSWTIICLGAPSPMRSSDQPEAWRAATLLLSGLASDGVYMCPLCYQRGGSLLHCLSTLTAAEDEREILPAIFLPSSAAAVYFCCTGLGVASTGCYPASCPVKPGLSSSAAFRPAQPRSSVLLNTVFDYIHLTLCCQAVPEAWRRALGSPIQTGLRTISPPLTQP